MLRPRHLLLPTLLLALVAACSSAPEDADTNDSAATAEAPDNNDFPWEVRSLKGETYLPNVFYAEASETDQIMPLEIHGRKQIDRLIYPTIGNPNLYVRGDKSDATEEFMSVLRIENKLLDQAGVKVASELYKKSRRLHEATGTENLKFFLVARSARGQNGKGQSPAESESAIANADGKTVFEVKPSVVLAHEISKDMPEPFKARTTLRVSFDHAAMVSVPGNNGHDSSSGLYDLRMELRDASGKLLAYEFQYNALRVFEQDPTRGDANGYSIINVTDTQVSFSNDKHAQGVMKQNSFTVKTLAHLKEFVSRVNVATEDSVRNAAFITFNGDLHNGGSPEALRPSRVAWEYNDEANEILDTLKGLNFPIYLTIGNHDGYVATGQVPKAIDSMLGSVVNWITGSETGTLERTVKDANPDFYSKQWATYKAFLGATQNDTEMGGRHVDVFTGQYRRLRGSQTFAAGWAPVPAQKRNFILYDGFYQWQRTYGPTYASWKFGPTRFVNLNSYELRQHRRSGWGMYTVNYGGGLSQVQAEWIEKELSAADQNSEDVVLIAHHDPRGGHNGKDYPYYFKQIDYRGMDESAKNYVQGEVLNPQICAHAPTWALTTQKQLSCLHDGLQEWMRADPEFDCDEADRADAEGHCKQQNFDAKLGRKGNAHPWYSGYVLLAKINSHPSVRTLVLGHTHYNSIEMHTEGEQLVPDTVTLDADSMAKFEAENPLRGTNLLDNQPNSPEHQAIRADGDFFKIDLGLAGHAAFQKDSYKKLQGTKRELAVLRLTSNADLTDQKYHDGRSMKGFTTFLVGKSKDARGYGLPQINGVNYFLSSDRGDDRVHTIKVDRTAKFANAQTNSSNPLCGIFQGSGSEACK